MMEIGCLVGGFLWPLLQSLYGSMPLGLTPDVDRSSHEVSVSKDLSTTAASTLGFPPAKDS